MLKPAHPVEVVLDHEWIAAHIPHQGGMCLLDAVLAWDAQHMTCRASSHRDATNPLRQFGRLGAACGVEYAAQAMAVHGALMDSTSDKSNTHVATPRPGMLVGIRSLTLHVAQLDDLTADLKVYAERLSGDSSMLLYAFAVQAGDMLLLEGRASVLLGPTETAPTLRT
jgi:predicted hotdog family 3-hydroxylacyl-ACP dehydratase